MPTSRSDSEGTSARPRRSSSRSSSTRRSSTRSSRTDEEVETAVSAEDSDDFGLGVDNGDEETASEKPAGLLGRDAVGREVQIPKLK